MTQPEARRDLPAAFAAALGQCAADFGWLEEMLKRAIHALETAPRAPARRESELEAGLVRMDSLADDTLSTLIEHLEAAMRTAKRSGGRCGACATTATCSATLHGGRPRIPTVGILPSSATAARCLGVDRRETRTPLLG